MHPYDEPHPLHDLDDAESLERAFWDDEPTRVLPRIGRLGASDVRRPVALPRSGRPPAARTPGPRSRSRRHAAAAPVAAPTVSPAFAADVSPSWPLAVSFDGPLAGPLHGPLDDLAEPVWGTSDSTAPRRRPGRAAVVVGPTTALTGRSRPHRGSRLPFAHPGHPSSGRATGRPADPFVRRLGALVVVAALVLVVVWSTRDGGDVLRPADTATAAAADDAALVDGVAAAGGPSATAPTDTTVTAASTPIPDATTVAPTASVVDDAGSVPPVEVAAAGPVAIAPDSIAPASTSPAPTAAPAPTAPAQTAPPTVPAPTAPPATVPAATAAPSTATTLPAAPAPVARISTSPDCANRYTVVAGDTWIGIATKVGTTTAALLAANDAGPSTLIYPGGRVCLPAGATAPAPSPSPSTAPAPTTPAATNPPATQPATTAPATTQPAVRAFSAAENEATIRAIWPDDLEEEALRIARRESNLQNRARNWCCSGLFQIYFDVHRSWLAGIGVTSAGQLLDPTVNAQAAFALYQRAGGFGPWEP